MILRYKEFLINIFSKIKSSLVNKLECKNVKFSIIEDILKFIAHLNKKYQEKINLNNVLQGDEETYEIINKTCNYLLDYFLILIKKMIIIYQTMMKFHKNMILMIY